jgi:hypothetical protein
MNVYTRLFAQSLHGEHFFRLGSPHYLVGNRINTEGGWVSRDRLRWSENSGLLALKLFDCERTAVTQLNKSLKLTGYVAHKSQLYRVGGAVSVIDEALLSNLGTKGMAAEDGPCLNGRSPKSSTHGRSSSVSPYARRGRFCMAG